MVASARPFSRFAWIALGVATSATLLWLAGRGLAWSEIEGALRNARVFPWIPLAVALYLAGHLVRGVRCRLLASRSGQLSTMTASNIVVLGYAVNNILPGRAGELARAGMLAERTGMPYIESLTITFLERVLDGVTIVAMFLASSAVVPLEPWMQRTAQVGAFVFASALLGVLAAVIAPALVHVASVHVSTRLPAPRRDAFVRLVSSVSAGVAALRSARIARAALVLSVVVWTLEAGMFLAVLPALGLAPRPALALLAMSLTNLGILVPSTPGFVGTFHFFCASALESQGVPAQIAVPYALVTHATFFAPITTWGVAVMLRYGVELSKTAALSRTARATRAPTTFAGVSAHLVARTSRTEAPDVPPRWLHAVIEALCPREDARAAQPTRPIAEVTAFVHAQLGELPSTLRAAFALGMLAFRAACVARYARPFGALDRDARAAWVNAWALGNVRLARQLFRPVRSLALFAYYEPPTAARAEDATPLAQLRIPSAAAAEEAS